MLVLHRTGELRGHREGRDRKICIRIYMSTWGPRSLESFLNKDSFLLPLEQDFEVYRQQSPLREQACWRERVLDLWVSRDTVW